MSLNLQITSAERHGETFVIETNSSIGRQADLSFDDPKMSKIHAIFELDRSLGWLIKDNNSKNGVIVNGSIVDSHVLEQNDELEIGSTHMRVMSVAAIWKPQLNQLLIDAFDSVKNHPSTAYPFRNIPALRIIQGLQAGETHILEYGPRHAGGECDDIQLYEPLCPDLAFVVSADTQGVWLETPYPKIVTVNDVSVKKVLLKKGDRIRIHKTLIEVDFLNI